MYKIVLVGSAYPLRGGLSTYNERLAEAFQSEGHDIMIYSFSLQYPELLFPGKTQYASGPPPKNLKIATKVNSINPLNWIKIGNEIKRMKPDFVLMKFWLPFMAPCLGTIARIIRSNGHTKVISIIDNIIPHEKRIGDKAFAEYYVNSSDAFVAMSQSVLNDLEKFDSKKKKVFNPHPLFDSFGELIPKQKAKEQLQLDLNKNYILFFGFIRAYKGLDLILQAFKDERLRELPLKLIIAGEYYEDEAPYKTFIKENGLEPYLVESNEFIQNQDVAKYFCAADLVVQPYKTATQSGVTQIAYHFDKPMIVTNVGGLPEIVPDNKVGYVVEPDPKEIADAILKFYVEQKETYFVEQMKEEKKRFSWEAMLDKIVALYQEISSN